MTPNEDTTTRMPSTTVVDGASGSTEQEVYVFPASLEQSRYWILDQLDGASTASNMAIAFRLEGTVDDDFAKRSIHAITERHEALRTNFRMVDGELSQVISEEARFSFSVSDLRSMEPEEARQTAEELLREHSRVRIDLADGPVFFVHLIHVTDESHFLGFTIHHIVCDGWSNGILVRDFSEFYAGFAENRPPALAALPFQFADFTVWQKEWLDSDAAQSSLTFWREHAHREMQAVDLPTDHPRSAKKSHPGDIESHLLPPELNARLKNYCRQNDATMHQVLLAAFEGLIGRYTGQSNFLLGSTIANRTQPGMENVVGRFANPQVILASVEGNPSYRELLNRVIDWSTTSYAHQDLPFSRLVEEFQLDQSGATSQFLQVYFVYQKAFMQPQQAGALKVIPRPSVSGGVNFDLLVSVVERAEGPRLQIEYNTALFEKRRIRALLAMYTRVLEAVMQSDTLRVSEFPLLGVEEKTILEGAGISFVPLDLAAESIPSWLDRLAEQLGDAPAILSQNRRVSWRELRARSLEFARGLRNLGVRHGQTIAIRMEPGLEVAAAAIAALRVGAVVLPIPPAMGVSEWNLILIEFKPVLSLASRTFVEQFSTLTSFEQLVRAGAKDVVLTGPPPGNPAWLNLRIDPKGRYQAVAISHEATIRALIGAARTLGLRQAETVLVWPANTSAQASCQSWIDLLLPLLAGATTRYPNGGSAALLETLLERERITFAIAAPAEFDGLLASGWKGTSSLHLVCRGVGMAAANLERLANYPGRVAALYTSSFTAGPFAIASVRGSAEAAAPLLPLAGQQLLLLDSMGNAPPFGVPGELVIREPISQLGSGPLTDVRTGYFARYSPQRGFELSGQTVRTVGLQGCRLRMEDLEELLYQDPQIAAVEATLARGANDKPLLVAYVTGRGGQHPSPQAVTARLRSIAPGHLSSAEIIPVDSFPRRVDGQANFAALPRPGLSPADAADVTEFVPPRDELQARLVSIWEEVLGVRGIGIRNSFFSLGGYSLMIVRLFARMNKALQTSLPITTIFNAPTIEQLADILRGHSVYSSLVPVQTSGSKPPLFMIHSYLLYEGLRKVLGEDRPFYGLRELDPSENISVEDRVAAYVREIRSVQPHGPYHLGGWCAAGPLTVETARQLSEAGETIAMTVLLDSWRPGYAEEFAAASRDNPNMALRAVLRRKYLFHRLKLKPLSTGDRVKYLLGFGAAKLRKSRDKFYLRHWSTAQRLFERFGRPLPNFMHNVSNSTLASVKEYKGQPYSGHLILIRATDTPYLPQAEPACGWNDMVESGVDVLFTPGTHESMFLKPNLTSLGEILNACLDRAADSPEGIHTKFNNSSILSVDNGQRALLRHTIGE